MDIIVPRKTKFIKIRICQDKETKEYLYLDVNIVDNVMSQGFIAYIRDTEIIIGKCIEKNSKENTCVSAGFTYDNTEYYINMEFFSDGIGIVFK